MPQRLDLQRYDTLTPQLDLQSYGNDWQGPIDQPPEWQGPNLPVHPYSRITQGLYDIGSELYHHIDTTGKKAAAQIGEGDYGGAFHSIFSPITDPVQGIINADLGFAQGKPFNQWLPGFETPEKSREAVKQQAIGAVGLPVNAFQEAWQQGDYARMFGQGAGALATGAIFHKIGNLGTAARPKIEVLPPDDTWYTRPSSFNRLKLEAGDIDSFVDQPAGPKVEPPPVAPKVAPERQIHFDGSEPVEASGDYLAQAGMENNLTFVENMKQGGYEFVGRTPDGQKSIFRKLLENEEGEFDFDAMLAGGKEVWESLQRRLGREPSVVEMEEEARLIRGRVAPGIEEPTGRVARMDIGTLPLRQITDGELSRRLETADDPIEVDEITTEMRRRREARRSPPDPIQPLRDIIAEPEFQAEKRAQLDRWFIEKRPQYQLRPWFMQAERMANQNAPTDDIIRFLQQNGADLSTSQPQPTQSPQGQTPSRMLMDPRMAERVEAQFGGPRTFDFTPPVPTQGQQTLPLVGELRENTRLQQLADADLRRNQLQAAADRFTRPSVAQPEQLSMAGDLGDSIISRYLQGEDATPPEMRDLSTYGPEKMYRGGGQEPPSNVADDVSKNSKIFRAFKQGLPQATSPSWRDTNFVLPDGTRLRHNSYTHGEGAQKLGFKDLDEVIQAGIIRIADDFSGAEIQAPITDAQAQILADAPHFSNNRMIIDVVVPGMGTASRTFTRESKADAIRTWVNSVFKRNWDEFEGPSFAKIEGGGLTASVDIKRAVSNITKDYTGELPGIMNREGMQNALDAVDYLGLNGKIHVRLDYNNNAIEIHDNGKGLDEEGLATKLVEIFSTGKEGESGATGGKGIGSASYIYGGKHFTVESIAVDRKDGKKYKITASGTPDQFLDPETGSDYEKIEVPKSTPTGTTIRTVLKRDSELLQGERPQNITHASNMLTNILENSRNRKATITVDDGGYTRSIPIQNMTTASSTYVKKHKIEDSNNDKLIGKFTTLRRNSEIEVLVPKSKSNEARDSFSVHYLNNGMYQFTKEVYLGGKGDGVPERVLVDIHPLVNDLHDDYPFINTREDVKNDIREEIDKFITDNVKSPGLSRRKNRVQELYDSMSVVPISGTRRKPIIFDPGNRLTPKEMQKLIENPVIKQLVQIYDSLIDNITNSTGRQNWIDRLEGVGIVLDPTMNGVHIPNPTTGKSSILINPFARITTGMEPKESAFRNTITNLHEVAHIGRESQEPIKYSPEDLADPRLGEFFESYMEQLVIHGDVGWSGTGHGMDFAHRLGEVYAKFGIQRTYAAANAIERVFRGENQSGGYSSEVQRLLHLYQESRRRDATTEDLLSGTGVKQADRGFERKRGLFGPVETNGDGVAAEVNALFRRFIGDETGAIPISQIWDAVKKGTGIGQGLTGQRKKSALSKFASEAIKVPSAATTTGDFSPIGRQGLPNFLTPQFWSAIPGGIRAMPRAGWVAMDRQLRAHPLHRKTINPNTGQQNPSIAERMGLPLYVPASEILPGSRVEAVASKWLETGGILGPERIGPVPNIPRKVYSATYGKFVVRPTARFFVTFMNQFMTNRAKFLMDRAQDMSIEALGTGRAPMQGLMGGMMLPKFMGEVPLGPHLSRGYNIGFKRAYGRQEAEDIDPYRNLDRAKEIAEFVKAAAGQAGPTNFLERSVAAIGPALFSPGFLNSRIRLLNPATYVMSTPRIRREYIKTAFGAVAAWAAFTYMAKMAADALGYDSEINLDWTNSDFGKFRIGDTRLDFGGGFLQLAVLIGRLKEGGWTSSSNPEEGMHEFGQGFNPETEWSTIGRFLENKLNPAAKFAVDVLSASENKPFNVADRTAQLFVNLFAQDLYETARDHPDLLGWMIPVLFGGGTQTYGKYGEDPQREGQGKFFNTEEPYTGGLRNLIPFGERQ